MNSTITQQKAVAIAPMPFAVLSCLSSSYVIFHLLCKERQNLKRMYHRLVLAMNVAVLLASSTWVWGPYAVPKGTPNFYFASGTIRTCTANGFIFLAGDLAVPAYYASLSLQAFVGLRYKFQEESYRWIEKFIHIIAWGVPLVLLSIAVYNESINPGPGSKCTVAQAPQGCDDDPDVPCQRGKEHRHLGFIVIFGLLFFYIIFTPSILITMYCWTKKIKANIRRSVGMQQMREQARSQMLNSMTFQMSIYLVSFWITWIPAFLLYRRSQNIADSLTICVNCLRAFQGVILAGVYFTLPIVVARKQALPSPEPKSSNVTDRTVMDIRADAARKLLPDPESVEENNVKLSFVFNIFDGTPDEDSPWAKFIDEDLGTED